MIKANELRIGNYVTDQFYENFKTVTKVKSLDMKGVNLEIADDGNWPEVASRWIEPEYAFDKLFGIPLTPVILDKCGFELFPWGWVKKSNTHFGVRLSVQNFSYEVSGNNPVKLAYLHQLQNLYFSLTGEELEIAF